MTTAATSHRSTLDDGTSIAFDTYSGEGSPVVLLHGIPGSRRSWRRVAQALSRDHPVIVPDLLGFGQSSEPRADFHARGQAVALLQCLDSLGHTIVHLVGFDFGGPTAVAAWGLAPERIATVTLVSTNVFTDTPIPPPLKAARVPVIGDLMFAAMCSWPGVASLWVPAVGDKRALPWREFMRNIPDRRSRSTTKRIFLDSLRHLRARYEHIEAILPGLSCPVGVVWGDADPFFPVAVGERTARTIPGASFHLLRGCGHFVPEERPDALVDAIATTINRAHRQPSPACGGARG